jgi:hypothetical protein
MEDIHEQVWICTEGDGYIIWGKGIHGENVFAGGDESGIKKLHVSILSLYKNVCINFVTYKFCYRIKNVCINFVTV